MIKAALFDMDDTLLATIETKWAHHKAVALQHYGITLTDETLRAHWGKPFGEMIDNLYEHADTIENMAAVNRAMDAQYLKQSFADSVSVLTSLIDDGIQVGVVTSTRTEWATTDLTRLGFPVDRMLLIQGEDAHHAHKPDPAVFDPARKLLADHGILDDEVIYVGDSLFDSGAAFSAGFHFIGVATGLMSIDDMHAAGIPMAASDIAEVGRLIRTL